MWLFRILRIIIDATCPISMFFDIDAGNCNTICHTYSMLLSIFAIPESRIILLGVTPRYTNGIKSNPLVSFSSTIQVKDCTNQKLAQPLPMCTKTPRIYRVSEASGIPPISPEHYFRTPQRLIQQNSPAPFTLFPYFSPLRFHILWREYKFQRYSNRVPASLPQGQPFDFKSKYLPGLYYSFRSRTYNASKGT